jgi:hypothetical protein
VTRTQQTAALRARDDGLRRVRKLTWRIGLLAAAGAAFIGARFAHLSPHLPSLTGGSDTGQSSSQSGSSSGISSSSPPRVATLRAAAARAAAARAAAPVAAAPRGPASGMRRRAGEQAVAGDPILCEAHGVCAELLPELIRLDRWGYPVLVAGPVPRDL